MNDPWFSPPWLPGLLVGAVCLLFGVVATLMSSARPLRSLLLKVHALLTAMGVGLLVLGVAAWLLDQPGTIIENLFVSGTVTVILMLSSLSVVRRFRDSPEE